VSRNLGQTCCDFCGGPVQLEEPAHAITPDEAGVYFKEIRGLLVANAACTQCGTRYLAWVDDSATKYAKWYTPNKPTEKAPFFDLSYRSTFNDEPADQDFVLSPWVRSQLQEGWAARIRLGEIREFLEKK